MKTPRARKINVVNNRFGKDLAAGSIPKNLIAFALPILIGNLLSTGYSVINTMWVGNLIGKDAVGAVAVSFSDFSWLGSALLGRDAGHIRFDLKGIRCKGPCSNTKTCQQFVDRGSNHHFNHHRKRTSVL